MEGNKRTFRRRRRTLAERMSWQPRRDSKQLSRWVALTIVLVMILAVVIYLAFFSSLFWLAHVTVTGTKVINPQEVSDFARAEAHNQISAINSRSLVLMDTDDLAKQVKDRFRDTAEIKITKKWPNALIITLDERQSTLLWKNKDSQYFLVDRQGVAFAASPPRDDLTLVEDGSGVPIEVGKQIVGAKVIKELDEIKQGMQAAGINLKLFRIPASTFEVQAVTDQGYYALFDVTRGIGSQVQALKAAVAQGKPREYADLRVPGRVYVK